jgi:hypothetical protein
MKCHNVIRKGREAVMSLFGNNWTRTKKKYENMSRVF